MFTIWLFTIIYNEALGRLRKSETYAVQLQLDVADNIAYASDYFLDGLKSLQLMERKELIQKCHKTGRICSTHIALSRRTKY